jgi:transposase-like protein
MKDSLKPLFDAFISLNEKEKQQFAQLVYNQVSGELDLESLRTEAKGKKRRQCPHCSGHDLQANGKNNGMQRYKCKSCLKNFSDSTGTALASIKKKDLWISYIKLMFEGKSLIKCAEQIGISKQTSFNWRHKILSRLRHEAPEKFEGICEIDDVFFNYSEKGSKSLKRSPRKRGNHGIAQGVSNDKVAVLITYDRTNNKDLQVIKRGRIRKKDLHLAIGNRLDNQAVICTDSHRSFTGFAKEKKLEIKKINARKGQHVVDKVYHVQHVNQTSQALKKWMDQFNGVATKYLQNYMNWFMMIEKLKLNSTKLKSFALAVLTSPAILGCTKKALFHI